MPEGDTLRRLAARIDARFAGQVVAAATFRHPRLATAVLDGRAVVSADARGKHLLVRFDDGRTLHAHLLMQGRVMFGPVRQVPEWRRRFELSFDGGTITGVDIPKLDLIPTRDERRAVGHLGPDLCGDYDHALAVRRFAAAGRRPLGGALLDQTLIAGFGNIYAVETPFIAGISPFQEVGSISDVHRVIAVGAALIRTNAARGPQNTTGRHLQRTEHWILSAGRRRCPICGSVLERTSARSSPWQRRTVRCPTCQPVTDRTSVDRGRVAELIATHPAARILDLDNGRLTVATDQPVEVR